MSRLGLLQGLILGPRAYHSKTRQKSSGFPCGPEFLELALRGALPRILENSP